MYLYLANMTSCMCSNHIISRSSAWALLCNLAPAILVKRHTGSDTDTHGKQGLSPQGWSDAHYRETRQYHLVLGCLP